MTCPELIARHRQGPEQMQTLVASTDLHRYGHLHPDGRHLIQSWYRRAERAERRMAQGGSDGESFEGLIFAWIAFNGWASCVTGKDTDKEMIEALSLHDGLRGDFDSLLVSDPSFREAADDFRSHWPVIKAQELAELNIWVAEGRSREERVAEYLRLGATRFSPPCWLRHREEGEEVPLDWPHTVSAIYQLRCNLFHGHKGTRSPNDRELVRRAFRVLIYFLGSSGYITDERPRQPHRFS